MGLRNDLLAGFSLAAVAASAGAQTVRPSSSAAALPPFQLAQAPSIATPNVVPATPPATAAHVAPPRSTPHTLAEALAATYSNQPALQAERAKLRGTDENVPAALAGWRPTVVLAGSTGYGDGVSRGYSNQVGRVLNVQTDRLIGTAQASVTQNLYNGGKVEASVNRAKNQVMAERANLIAQEQTSFNTAVSAYVGVIQARQLQALQINNEQVLAKQLQATNDRFRVGEITRTDVAQAEARVSGGTRDTRNGGGQSADRPWHVSAGHRCFPARGVDRAAAVEPADQERAGRRGPGRDKQS